LKCNSSAVGCADGKSTTKTEEHGNKDRVKHKINSKFNVNMK
jgi:hypothetical protein